MKKAFVWALMATLAVAGSAFAVPSKVTANATFATGAPATTDNDDSCDISVAPAATLLLPYFEVDMSAAPGAGDTTLFTVTNTSQYPAIAHVTIWTDWSYPVLDFNIFLTGYDVQSVNMYNILVRGELPRTGSTDALSNIGARSINHASTATGFVPTAAGGAPLILTDCTRLATRVGSLLPSLQNALVDGTYPGCDGQVGTDQPDGRARGYVTIDVANRCSTSLPTEPDYFEGEILYDNVLIGDYQQVDPANNFAQGSPMVHIRAIPEGGDIADTSGLTTNFDRTFYSRFQLVEGEFGVADRRQPLPSTFAARWISGGVGAFNTTFKIWREGYTTNENVLACDGDGTGVELNSEILVTELVRFDEEENPQTFAPDDIISPGGGPDSAFTPETSRLDVADEPFPPVEDGAVAGWMYLNLDNGTPASPGLDGLFDGGVASQNWVIVSMEAEGRYSVDFDAAWLGNGCSAPVGQTPTDRTSPNVGPRVDRSTTAIDENVTPDLPIGGGN